MLEWHAHATQEGIDIWMRGRFLEEWADPRAVDALPAIFAHYNEADVWHALLATMDLFSWLARETTEILKYAYPHQGEEHAAALVRQLKTHGG
jgi:hypothetical protein